MEEPDDKPDDRPTLLERLSAFLTREPEDRGELLDLLRSAFERRLLDADALSMIEGVLSVSETTVRDIMIPRAQMDCVSIDDDPPDFLPLILETKHSRFPVIGESKDDVMASCSPRSCSTITRARKASCCATRCVRPCSCRNRSG